MELPIYNDIDEVINLICTKEIKDRTIEEKKAQLNFDNVFKTKKQSVLGIDICRVEREIPFPRFRHSLCPGFPLRT